MEDHHPGTEGLSKRAGEGECFVTPLQGLVGIPKDPQSKGSKGMASHPCIIPIDKGMGTVLLRVIESSSLLEMFSGLNKLSQIVQHFSLHQVSSCNETRIVEVLRQSEELFAQLTGRL